MNYWINDVYFDDGDSNTFEMTIFQKCSDKGIDIPCFCYHERLSIAGNCRMCLVETNKSPLKLVVSCSMPIENGVKIYTNNSRINKARESVLEFLLNMHPLDCPICDQGGECDLQDITLIFGSDRGRFYEYDKRAVFDKDCGPFIKTIMTRCIHCTRCVRFLSEVSGVNDLGILGRGNFSEISTFIYRSLNDELSGNIIDLCPVGALTSKPYAFNARPWELNSVESIDILDNFVSNIRVDFLNNKIYRVLPIYDKTSNEDWITNKARFSYDSHLVQRIINPILKFNGEFVVISWLKAFKLFFDSIIDYGKDGFINCFIGNMVDLKSCIEFKKFFNKMGCDIKIGDFIDVENEFRYNYLFSFDLNQIENWFNILFLSVNLRLESPLLNAKFRKIFLNNKKIKFFCLGISSYYNFPIVSIGNSVVEFMSIIECRSLFFNEENSKFDSIFKLNLKKKLLIVNGNLNISNKFLSFLNNNFVTKIVNVLQYPGYINFFEVGYQNTVNSFSYSKTWLFLNGVDNEIFIDFVSSFFDKFIVYYGSFFDYGAKKANLILPSLCYFENDGIFLNFEGKVKNLKKIISSNVYNVDQFFKSILSFKEFFFLNNFSNFYWFNNIMKFFKFIDIDWAIDIKLYVGKRLNICFSLVLFTIVMVVDFNNILNSTVLNYYKSDVILKNSKNMHLASLEYLTKLNTF